MPSTSTLESRIRQSLSTQFIAQKIHVFDELASTNDWVLSHSGTELENGTVVIADRQSAGKGRLGRSWYSPSGGNLYLSIHLTPQMSPAHISRLTMVAGAACCEALSTLTGKAIQLKWPNDLYYENRKLGGILCESHLRGNKVLCAVIGIGINIHLDRGQLPDELKQLATSLQDITSQPLDRGDVTAAILNALETRYHQLVKGQWSEIVTYCDQHNILKGKTIELESAGEKLSGRVTGLDAEGQLVMTLTSGEERHFIDGDTRVKKSCS